MNPNNILKNEQQFNIKYRRYITLFSLCVEGILFMRNPYKKGLCPTSGDIKRLMMMMMI
jgi:hypothetical protein